MDELVIKKSSAFLLQKHQFYLLSHFFLYLCIQDTSTVAILIQKFPYPRCDKSILVKVELPQFLDEPDNDNFDKWEEPEDVKEASPKR
jgi:hypothetical protein